MARILVVDDEEDIRLLLRMELSAEGHHIAEAADGQAALDALGAGDVDLMLLDIMMPVLDGWSVLAALDASAPPVIVVTGINEGDPRIAQFLELGALDVIIKPFDVGRLYRLAEAVLLVEPEERAEYRRQRLAQARQG
jgi:two-component system alkaline phosphatase synthesis response regulator PhoP